MTYRWAQRGLIAIGALAVLGGVAIALLIGASFWNGPRFAPAKVETADRKRGFTIGDVTAIERTRFVRINVSENEGRQGSYSYTRDDLRNVLILDTANGRSWRLLPNNERRIAAVTWLPAAATPQSNQAVTDLAGAVDDMRETDRQRPPDAYFLFSLDRADNGYDLVAGTIDGRSRGVIMRGIDGLDSSWIRAADQLAVIVREGGRLYYRTVDLKTYRTIQSQPIAIDR